MLFTNCTPGTKAGYAEARGGAQTAVAVDTRFPYVEVDLGQLDAAEQIWIAPYESDWAIAVGSFN